MSAGPWDTNCFFGTALVSGGAPIGLGTRPTTCSYQRNLSDTAEIKNKELFFSVYFYFSKTISEWIELQAEVVSLKFRLPLHPRQEVHAARAPGWDVCRQRVS